MGLMDPELSVAPRLDVEGWRGPEKSNLRVCACQLPLQLVAVLPLGLDTPALVGPLDVGSACQCLCRARCSSNSSRPLPRSKGRQARRESAWMARFAPERTVPSYTQIMADDAGYLWVRD
jgi:hypothetical protein